MTWKDKVIIRILLMISRMLTDDDKLKLELNSLAAHISVGERTS